MAGGISFAFLTESGFLWLKETGHRSPATQYFIAMSEKDAGRGFLEKAQTCDLFVHVMFSGAVHDGVSLHNAKFLLSLRKTCAKLHETWNI